MTSQSLTVGFMAADSSVEASALRCWVEAGRICLALADRREVSFPASKYPLLAKASPSELRGVKLRLGGRALRWESWDEDIWVEDAVRGCFPRHGRA